ncbi:MAG: diguanylate cyclase [Vicinamibacteria bacterium]|nr:diguanylate cyclase [Vicinamibacteria bacterium]
MNWKRRSTRAACALLLVGAPLKAGSHGVDLGDPRHSLTQYKIDRWQTEQGLPLDTVQCLLRTRDGYLWVGTAGGLARFDGIRFLTFPAAEVSEITSLPIFGLMEDNEGRLWIGHSKGAAIYRNGRFEPAFPGALTDGRRVWDFAQGPDGVVWAASENGLVRIDKGATRVYRQAEGLPTNRLRTLAFDRDGVLWIGTTGGGVVSLVNDRFQGLKHEPQERLEIRSLLADPAGGVWAATAGHGLLRIQGGETKRYSIGEGLPTDQLTSLARDEQGALWVGTWGAGVSRLRDGRFTSISAAGGLAGDQIWSLLADSEGSVWIGTWVGGLNRLSTRSFVVFGTPEGLSKDNVRSVLHARDGATWVGTAGGGVNKLEDGRVIAIRKRDGLPSDEASTLFEDRDGAIWVGTYTAGAARIKGGNVRVFGLAQGLPNVDVHAFLRDQAGVLWVGTMSGLARLDGDRFVPVRDPGSPRMGVMGILQDRSGVMWFATSEGLVRYRDGKFDVLTKADGLPSNWILALHEDGAGTLWIGTNGEGMGRYRNGRMSAIRAADGLWDGLVQAIVEDKSGHLWVTCNRGFYRLSIQELNGFADGRLKKVSSAPFGPGDALRSTSFAGGHQAAAAIDEKGLIWLPSFNGLVIVDPNRLPGSGLPPPVLIEEVVVNGVSVAASDGVILPPGSLPISIHYTAMTLVNAGRARFRYRMDGLTPDWVDAGRSREASFPGLPAGAYDFRVAASIDGEHWQEAPATLSISVKPYLYQTRTFAAAVLVGAVGLTFGIIRLRTRQMRLLQVQMERQVAEKTEELRLANEHLRQLSFLDAQTGLANRRRFDETLDKEWRRASRFQTSLAVVMADIDAFKPYNDTLGHPEGDQCLAAVAEVFKQSVARAGDLAARYGGEEFVVLIPSADLQAARAVAERLRRACEARAIPHPASPVGPVVTISLGVAACVPKDDNSSAALVAEADAALYRAKREGRNRVC